MNKKCAVAFFSDKHMLPGLHVSLLSLLRSLDEVKGKDFSIHLFLDNVPEREKRFLEQTHAVSPKGTTLVICDYVAKCPPGANLLRGNMTVYGPLFLAELLPDYSNCLYLDCDLYVNRPIHDLFEHFDGQHVLFVDGCRKRSKTIDGKLYEAAGLDMEGCFFNSGVMAMDLDLWRQREISKQCGEVARKYAGLFHSADQALMNVALDGQFKALGDSINTILFPKNKTPDKLEPRIYHYVGAPKPWDFLGSVQSQHYRMWHAVYRKTAIKDRWSLRYTTLKRALRMLRQLLVR